jgi:hypothetical protein
MSKNNLTMQEIRTLLGEKVDAWNAETDISLKVKLERECKDLVKDYNETSMFTVFSNCFADEQPVVAFAKAYYYNVISIKKSNQKDVDADGKAVTYEVYSVVETDKKGNKLHKTLDLVKFLEWTEQRNKCAAADKNWRTKFYAARDIINDECKIQMNSKDGYKISKNKIKTALQEAFDALAFIKSKTGKNAIIAKGKLVDPIQHLVGKLEEEYDNGSPDFTVSFLKGDEWKKLAFVLLNLAVRGKEFTIVYGDPEEPATEDKTETETTTNAETEAKA